MLKKALDNALHLYDEINIPELSPSKCFHGMPLRTLLGDGNPEIVRTTFSKLSTSQLLMAGQRDLDEPEKRYIDEHKIDLLSVDVINSGADHVVEAIKAKGSDNIYIHIDLDVLDYNEFPYVMVPSPNGLKTHILIGLLRRLRDDFNIVGLSLLEYTSSKEPELKVLSEIIRIGIAL